MSRRGRWGIAIVFGATLLVYSVIKKKKKKKRTPTTTPIWQ
jgi:hypothetical protein